MDRDKRKNNIHINLHESKCKQYCGAIENYRANPIAPDFTRQGPAFRRALPLEWVAYIAACALNFCFTELILL